MTIKLKSVLKWLKCGFSERSKLASHSTVYCSRKVLLSPSNSANIRAVSARNYSFLAYIDSNV